jgi:glycosyltransferase involved in cell wall biosynthesis
MRVSLDGGPLSFPPSGVRTYLEELVRGIGRVDPGVDLQVLEPPRSGDATLSRRARFAWDAYGVGRAAARSRVDVLHVPQFSAPFRAPSALVVTIHDVIPLLVPEYRQSRAMRIYLEVMRRTVRKADALIVPSRFVRDQVIEALGPATARVHIVPMAAADRYRPRAAAGDLDDVLAPLGIDGPYVFDVAGFEVRKNLPCLLEAFGRFRREGHGAWKLVIAGAPHTANRRIYPPILPIIERLGLRGAVVLPGRVDEATKLALYQGASLYVTTSLHEGFGMTCLEAMACGVPIIASRRASLPEVVGDGGLLVEPEPEAVAEVMIDLASNPDLAQGLRVRALARATAFSWDETARQTVAVYREAAARYSSASQPR